LAGDIRIAGAALTDTLITDPLLTSAVQPDPTRRSALIALFVGILAIAGGYAGAFTKGGTPPWAPWLLALGIPLSLGAIMILGAARGARGIGPLKLPFLFVVAILAVGFCAALALPATESPLSRLWLGLPARAAVVIYGVGLLPIVVLPIAYALTFETQTLSAEDVERVRELGRAYKARAEAFSDEDLLEPTDE
jgi:drug/metabolite transporter (DMT)-like permease